MERRRTKRMKQKEWVPRPLGLEAPIEEEMGQKMDVSITE